LTQRTAVSGNVHVEQPRRALARDMLHDHPDRARAGREIHGAADQRALVGKPHVPVGEIAVGRDLERAETATSMWPPRIMANDQDEIDDRGAGPERDAPAAGIDQSVSARSGAAAGDANHAVLRLDEDVDLGRM
jgi:hypothetical protein